MQLVSTVMINSIKVKFEKSLANKPFILWFVTLHKSYEKNNGSQKVAYITYYMFLSALPLLIVSLTIFDIVFASKPEIRDKLIDSTFSSIPVVGPTLEANLSFVQSRGITLIITGLILIWAARAGANSILDALSDIFKVGEQKPNFVGQQIKAVISITLISVGIVLPTFLQASFSDNIFSLLTVFIFNILWNAIVLYLLFALSVGRENAFGFGIIFGGVGITLVQTLSALFLRNSLDNQRPLYGILAVVLVFIAWISLQIRVLIYAALINAMKREVS